MKYSTTTFKHNSDLLFPSPSPYLLTNFLPLFVAFKLPLYR